jgi:hypothetical protein
MLRPTILAVLVPLWACGGTTGSTGSTTNPNDLSLSQVFDDLAPSVCNRIQQCDPTSYAQAFPNGESDCAQLFESDDRSPGEVVPCTADQATACGNDIMNEPCSQIAPAVGSPTLPASCNGC